MATRRKVLEGIGATSLAMVLNGRLASAAAAKPFKIGVSNAYVDTWRSQMIDRLEDANATFVKMGVTSNLMVQSGATNVQGQIAQIRSLMNDGVDALLVMPASQSALNPVLEEATEQGIKVFATAQEVSSPGVTAVMIDQAEWGRINARWLADALGGKGDVVVINGLAGAPADKSRYDGMKEIFDLHPEIRIINAVNGDWDQVKAQQVMSSVLAAQPKIDGVWISGAMSEGVLRSLIAANPAKWPIMTGDGNLGYLRLWKKVLAQRPDFKSVGIIDPPGIASTAALRVAVKSLSGDKINPGKLGGATKNALIVTLPPPVQAADLDKVLKENADRPDSYFLDVDATDQDVARFFE